MVVVKAQKLPQKPTSFEDQLASFCYYFPQYTFFQAKKLPYKRVVKMLMVARKEQARKMYLLTRIVAAPHSKNGSEVGKLLKEFGDIINE